MKKSIVMRIDGKDISTTAGTNLLQVARDNGFDIPGLCYHRKVSPTGACRLCVVKKKGEANVVMSCTLTAEEGLEITAFDDDLEALRTKTLSYLLLEHNEESDGTYADELQTLLQRYNIQAEKQRELPEIAAGKEFRIDDSSPVLSHDPSKCIKCFRCIKACEEVQGKGVLSFSERGINSYIIAGIDDWGCSECDGCGECVQLCPTGALVEKSHRKSIDLAKIDRCVQTTCPYCGVGCQLELLVQNEILVRSNGVESVSPNDGRLCVKGRFGYDFVHHSDRLTTPLIKVDGQFVKATWDEALKLVAQRFSEIKEIHGADSLAGYASAKCTNEDNYLFQKFIRIAFGTNNIDYCTRLCHASTVTAMIKSLGDGAGSNSIEDFARTKCLFVTGNNIIETHPVTATYIKNGKAKGNHIIVCDPKWTPLVKYADIWLQPRLGTDVALLNGMIRVIIEEDLVDTDFIVRRVEKGLQAVTELKQCVEPYNLEKVTEITSVPEDLIAEAARMYATSDTAMIATGMGMSQQVVGTNNVFALINMMLISGQIGKPQAGLNPPRGQNNVQGATDVGCSPLFLPGYLPVSNEDNRRKLEKLWGLETKTLPADTGLTTVEIIRAAGAGKIKGMYIMGENPMVTDPDLNHTRNALLNLDFLVVQDIFPTETSKLADVILPSASFAEKDGTFVNSDRRVLRVRKAIQPQGEAEEDWKITMRIAERMGFGLGAYTTAEDIFHEIAIAAPMMSGISYERLDKITIQWPCPTANHPGTSTLFLDRFNTESGKAKIHPVEYTVQAEKVDEEYPFILNSGRILYQYHSSTMSRRNNTLNAYANSPYLLMNVRDAEKFGFSDGEMVRVISRRGALKTPLRTTSEVSPGELFMPWHFPEAPVNALTRGELDPYSKIAPFKYSACRVEKLG